jgi:hypothetical protein
MFVLMVALGQYVRPRIQIPTGRNTELARFVVVLLKGKGAPILYASERMMIGTVRSMPSAFTGSFHLGKDRLWGTLTRSRRLG